MLVDPSTGKADAGLKLDSLDVYDQLMASENERGGVSAGELGGQHTDAADLLVTPMPSLESAAFSPDGHFLAYSGHSRSSIWDLNTQKRVALMRPFRGVHFDDQSQMFVQYPQSHQKAGLNYHIDLTTGKATEGAKYAIDQFQCGYLLITFQPLEKNGDVGSNINLQVSDLATGAQLWSRHFAQESPIVR
jgi:WD40 repeat protein